MTNEELRMAQFEQAMIDLQTRAVDGRGLRVCFYTGPRTASDLRRATVDFGRNMVDEGVVVFLGIDDSGQLQESQTAEIAAWENLALLARATAAAIRAGL